MFGCPFAEGLDGRRQASPRADIDAKERRCRIPERNVYQPSRLQVAFDPELIDEYERATPQCDLTHELE